MTKIELIQKTDEVLNTTKEALQIIYDLLNQGQQKQIVKNKDVKDLLERYNITL